ncbi:transglycosylase domain-containing protein [Pseudomarimonas arenosa]|uniref:peptidoglycan glycosyltransferase n=1 Tax=Pseudomarimonas arenosa TaxID=2774145 RepID=A0AAW3ZLQ9_9GAMM|nr:transglycosylase domain-containing protein [Pseudomarimonas arenosa]MBD8526104.1 transglycosylase domain-containing protein [Pseudomarimonas arenosa]
MDGFEAGRPEPETRPQSATARRRRGGWRRLLRWGIRIVVVIGLVLAAGLWFEMRYSPLQAHYLSRYADRLQFRLAEGASENIHFPREGPFDKRLGYAYLPLFLQRALERGYAIDRQAVLSPELVDFTDQGYYPPYPEKTQAGLSIRDCAWQPLWRRAYPGEAYARFEDVPPLVAQALTFIEDRHLLDVQRREINPAVDWPRLFSAAWSQLEEALGWGDSAVGGSTLATQIEKFRHSPDGLTSSFKEKWRQMASASVRAYQHGQDTLNARRDLLRDYLNTVPLSAVPGHGEVHGLADGLRVWFGADFARVNQLLSGNGHSESALAARGLALRQVLALLVAQRRPSYYLAQGRVELNSLIDSHLRLLQRAGRIEPALRDAALAAPLEFRDWASDPIQTAISNDKGTNLVRRHLASLLNVPLYSLDRLDLDVDSSLDAELQREVSAYLDGLREPEAAKAAGLLGHSLLQEDQLQGVRYSFTLYERLPDRFAVRVQTDSTRQAFDLSENSKLELGSTAKLRVVATYLEVIAELHGRYSGLPARILREIEVQPADRLTRWVLSYLAEHPQADLSSLLQAAMQRRYSASPHERFLTGGGIHRFSNFQRKDDLRVASVAEAMRDSLNLPFVRLMRDIVNYSIYQSVPRRAELLGDDDDPRREDYLRRFVDKEGQSFLRRFWDKYRDKDESKRIDTLLEGLAARPARLGAVFRYLYPQADAAALAEFLRQRGVDELPSQQDIEALHARYRPDAYALPDRAYIARVHPLDLWLLAELIRQPNVEFSELLAASTEVRQEVYGWLFRSRHKQARDNRIRIMLEVEAFLDIHQRWQKLGYPFGHLVPSLATALGSSGDRPAALAELVGIILNDGIRLPTVRISELRFADGTPYHTELKRVPAAGQQVMAPEVAAVLREALNQVVERGTARRLKGSFADAASEDWRLGGKTGTGDNRIESVDASGRVIESRARNRTATFVFYLGDRYFGTLTAFVLGENADDYRFTSALPVQALKGMQPILQPRLTHGCAQIPP